MSTIRKVTLEIEIEEPKLEDDLNCEEDLEWLISDCIANYMQLTFPNTYLKSYTLDNPV